MCPRRLIHPTRISTSLHSFNSFPACRRQFSWGTIRYDKSQRDHSASAKLFAEAIEEEAEEQRNPRPPPKLPPVAREYENWTGEESMEDAVLRMLVDKYKPLRTGAVRTAEEKLRQAPPKLSSSGQPVTPPIAESESSYATTSASTASALADRLSAEDLNPASLAISHAQTSGDPSRPISNPTIWANKPLIPAVEGHRPWHTTYKAPSHATSQASVKYGRIPPSSSKPKPTASELAADDRLRRKELASKKRAQVVGRLTNARESTLDYRLGIRGQGQAGSNPNPTSMRGWQGLVEDRIERARLQGHFRNIKGRGKPIERQNEEANPFIGREEFLMNRIVKRQGAAPPWVEFQQELEIAVTSFRGIVREAWTRRAIRTLTMGPPALIPSYTVVDIQRLRDPEWEERERAYHHRALEELNNLVRRFNGVAPYAVRRPYYTLDVELAKAYEASGEDILKGIKQRLQDLGTSGGDNHGPLLTEEGERSVGMGSVEGGMGGLGVVRIRDVIRGWFRGRA